MGLFLSHLSFN